MTLFKPSRVPIVSTWFFPSSYVWNKKTSEKTIYLTFDDGPVPEVTEFVLDTLSRKRKKPIPATFFCIGDNVRKYPALFKRIISEGHRIGNHTFNHVKGTRTANHRYVQNVQLAKMEIEKHLDPATSYGVTLFRPPYGRIKRSQAKLLKKLGYQIIMYTSIAYDWDHQVTPEQCLRNVIGKARDGDIIVFHDSVKAYKNLKYTLPKAIQFFDENGFNFEKL